MEGKERDSLIKWFSELSNDDVAIAGGKGASLAEMYNAKFPVPPGFVVTAKAYQHFIEFARIADTIKHLLQGIDIENTNELTAASEKIRHAIEHSPMPQDLADAITEAYDILDVDKQELSTNKHASEDALDILRVSHEPPFVAVRSSATTEDLVDASFAGQQDSYLNIKGGDHLIIAVKKAFSSLFTPRAIYYRTKKGFAHDKAYLAVVVQTMVAADKSGVMFSRNPLKNDPNIIIESVWGLGVGIVSGQIVPDHYAVTPDLEIVDRKIAFKRAAYTRNSSGKNEFVKLTEERGRQEVLSGHEVKVLAQLAKRLEAHYKKPQDIEFAITEGTIYITQSRPITTEVKVSEGEVTGEVLLKGLPASPGVAPGRVRIIHDISELSKVEQGDVLVTTMTNPDMVVSMQKAAAIVTDEGGVTSHAAIVSREMGIPAVVGTDNATQTLKDGQEVTVDGFTGRVLAGKGEAKQVTIEPIVPTNTTIKVIVDLPEYAQRAALSQSKAVGLVRLEGIIASIGKHPAWFVTEQKIKEYVAALFEGMKTIATPFESVWFRTSDVRSDEYATLAGAPEDKEANPMLGNHGIRFSLQNQDILEAEFTAIKELSDEFPNKTIGVMLPQVISVDEVQDAKAIFANMHMPKNVQFGIMIETPAAVQIINDLCEVGIDFVSFGTNDLTQYTLALDRNNEHVQHLYDEMNPAVLNSIRYVIRRCKKYGVKTSICGQAGSKPKMAAFLVQEGIDSISVNADAAKNVSEVVAQIEQQATGAPPKEPVVAQPAPQSPVVEPQQSQEHPPVENQSVKDSPQAEQQVNNSPPEPEQSAPPQMHQATQLVDKQHSQQPAHHQSMRDELEQQMREKQEKTAGQEDETEALLAEWDYEDSQNTQVTREADSQESEQQPIPSSQSTYHEDEYNPGVEHSPAEDIPSLNDAIPVDSDEFVAPSSQGQELELDEHQPTFEEQEEAVFEDEIEQEIKDSEVREAVKKQMFGQDAQQSGEEQSQEQPKEEKKDTVLDIF